jgi:hypothetical protein
LYKAERKGKRRKRWLTRIYCRYSHLRRKKEMKAVASAESFVRPMPGFDVRKRLPVDQMLVCESCGN